MGLLNQQFSANPAQANAAALQWGAIGTGLQAGGQFSQGVGMAQAYGFKAALDQQNAAIAAGNARTALEGGDYEAAASKLRYGELEGKQKAAMAANGVDVGSGSAAATLRSTETISAMDAAMIHYNAARQAYGDQIQANSLKAQAGADRLAAAGALAGGTLGAANTILGGAAGLSQKWAQFKQLSDARYAAALGGQ
jgi:hypothetical protein